MSSGFVTAEEAAEARKRRQEEWEKVRTPDQPLERPEEPYDGRSLYDRLKEQKMKKDMEYEEAHKLKNLIRGLDDDEVQFLELVDQSKLNAEKQQMQEEERELKDFRNRVATLQEETVDKKIKSEIKQQPKSKSSASSSSSSSSTTARPTQKTLLGVGIKRKNGETSTVIASSCSKAAKIEEESATKERMPKPTTDNVITTNELDKGNLQCIAVLPGIGPYTESSDSEMSSGSEDEPETCGKYDLVGRKRQKRKLCQDE